jgi:hypothetical protein
MIKFRFLLIFCLTFVVSSCAGHNMALTKGQSNLDVSKKSMVLLSVKISNQYKPEYQLDIMNTMICPKSEKCGHGSFGSVHKSDSSYKIKSVENSFNEYLLSYELESGSFNFQSIGAAYDQGLISGGGMVPLNFKLDVKPNSIAYLGHLDIVMRERKNNNEERAGRIMSPLQQNPVVGAVMATYDVVVEDKFEEDMKLFISQYPALQKVKVEKSIFPQWIRPENQPAD